MDARRFPPSHGWRVGNSRQLLRLQACDLAGKAFFFGSVLPEGYPVGLWRLPKEMNSAFRPKALDLDLDLDLDLEDLELDLRSPQAKNKINSFRLKAGHFL